MSEPRCQGCNHPEPLHTMKCEYRNPLYPILRELISEINEWHLPDPDNKICEYCTDRYAVMWPCPTAAAAHIAESKLNKVFK